VVLILEKGKVGKDEQWGDDKKRHDSLGEQMTYLLKLAVFQGMPVAAKGLILMKRLGNL
jgi:hypothetical protein